MKEVYCRKCRNAVGVIWSECSIYGRKYYRANASYDCQEFKKHPFWWFRCLVDILFGPGTLIDMDRYACVANTVENKLDEHLKKAKGEAN